MFLMFRRNLWSNINSTQFPACTRGKSGDNRRRFWKTGVGCRLQCIDEPNKKDATNIQERLPNFHVIVLSSQRPVANTAHKKLRIDERTSNQQLQSDHIPTDSLKRFETILFGSHASAFCQTMDKFISGFGKLGLDSDVLFVRFKYEEKINFWKKIYSDYVSNIRASYEEQSELHQHQSFF